MSPTVVSCPGKVLLAGGYLVLDRDYRGLVLATPSRFYTVVSSRSAKDKTVVEGEPFEIEVRSPQFIDGNWLYSCRKCDNEWIVEEIKTESSSSNSFVHLSLQYALKLSAASCAFPSHSLNVTILGSNDFYSQSREKLDLQLFEFLNCTIKDVHKTGLGSSAAMVTSLTSGLFLHWMSLDSIDQATKALLHNLSQFVHSLAQGKVGSGFDVSAAIWGSQIYQRFAPSCLAELLDTTTSSEKVTSKVLLEMLSPIANPAWTNSATAAEVSPFTLPPGLILILAEVDAGSNTPSMVGKLLGWRKKESTKAEAIWKQLSLENSKLAQIFGDMWKIYQKSAEQYMTIVSTLASLPLSKKSSDELLLESARQTINNIRALMKGMGAMADVPIEPEEQSRLLDACSQLPGVIGAGVPGAGGYDAIWVLALSPTANSSSGRPPQQLVTELMKNWEEISVRPLSRHAWVQGGVTGAENGIGRHTLGLVDGLSDAVHRRDTE